MKEFLKSMGWTLFDAVTVGVGVGCIIAGTKGLLKDV